MKLQCIIVVFIIYSTSFGNALQCHICQSRNGNRGKCRSTVITCDQAHDVCLSEVRSHSHWIEEGDSTYYISKGCARKNDCEESQQFARMAYFVGQEWLCYDCCKDDLCNYSPTSCIRPY